MCVTESPCSVPETNIVHQLRLSLKTSLESPSPKCLGHLCRPLLGSRHSGRAGSRPVATPGSTRLGVLTWAGTLQVCVLGVQTWQPRAEGHSPAPGPSPGMLSLSRSRGPSCPGRSPSDPQSETFLCPAAATGSRAASFCPRRPRNPSGWTRRPVLAAVIAFAPTGSDSLGYWLVFHFASVVTRLGNKKQGRA